MRTTALRPLAVSVSSGTNEDIERVVLEAVFKLTWRPFDATQPGPNLKGHASVAAIPLVTMVTYGVVVSLPHEHLFIEGDDLEDVLAQAQECISRNGVVIHLDPALSDGDDVDDDRYDDYEPASIEWNPFRKFVAGRN
jgi:hypothetical protein